jgi:hypothetical protein
MLGRTSLVVSEVRCNDVRHVAYWKKHALVFVYLTTKSKTFSLRRSKILSLDYWLGKTTSCLI